MGVADGAIVGTTKIVDHGPDAARWVVVLLAEGFQASELGRFRNAANAFVDTLFRTEPFRWMWCAINVYRVDVTSTDSGADEPATCGDGTTGSGISAATYFDASFCQNNTDRLLYGNQMLALTTASNAVPEMDATVVIVNSTKYGGAGGATAWYSLADGAEEIALHELGHAAFRLADEYGDTTPTWTGGEPPEPNVTTITDRATTKWADRIASATPLPTQENTGCAAMTTAPSPVPSGAIGLFAGGTRTFCGIYHPEHVCRMRVLGNPFCAVCSDAIIQRLRPHLPQFSEPVTGTQFHGMLDPGQTQRWFTYDWPACWHVLWTVMPTTPVTTERSLDLSIAVQQTNREHLTYWLTVTNRAANPVEFDGRYEIVARL